MKKLLFSGLSIFALTCSAIAEPFVIDKSHTSVAFKIRHMGISNVNGRFDDYNTSIDFDLASNKFNKLKAEIMTKSVDTDNQNVMSTYAMRIFSRCKNILP